MTPNVTPSQLNLAVGGSGVLARIIVDGSSGGRSRGRQRPKSIERPLLFSCFALISHERHGRSARSFRRGTLSAYGAEGEAVHTDTFWWTTCRPRTRSDALETADGVVALPISRRLSCLDLRFLRI